MDVDLGWFRRWRFAARHMVWLLALTAMVVAVAVPLKCLGAARNEAGATEQQPTEEIWQGASGHLAVEMGPVAAYLTVSGDGKTMATTSGDHVELWDIGGLGNVPSLSSATTSADQVEPWDAAAVVQIKRIKFNQGGMPRALALSPDGRWLATGNGKVLDVASGQEVAKLARFGKTLYSFVQFTDDGSRLVAAHDKKVEVYAAKNWQLERAVSCPVADAYIGSVAVSSDARVITVALGLAPDWPAPGAEKQALTVWDSQTGQQLLALQGYRHGVALSPDGKMLAASSSNGEQLEIISVESGKSLHQQTGRNLRTAFSPDGRLLAVAQPGVVGLLRVGTYDTVAKLAADFPWLDDLAFSRDGRMVLASENWRSFLWTPNADRTIKRPVEY